MVWYGDSVFFNIVGRTNWYFITKNAKEKMPVTNVLKTARIRSQHLIHSMQLVSYPARFTSTVYLRHVISILSSDNIVGSWFCTILEITFEVRSTTNHVHRCLQRIQHNFCIDEFNICMLRNCFWANFKIIWHVRSSLDHVHVFYCWSRVPYFLSRWSEYDLHWMEYDGIFHFHLLDVQYQRTSSSVARKGIRDLLTIPSSI